MDTTLKRKNIDLPVDTLKKLSLMAVAQGKSLKAYIDKWFDDPVNMESVNRGIEEMKAGKGTTYSMDKLRELLDS